MNPTKSIVLRPKEFVKSATSIVLILGLTIVAAMILSDAPKLQASTIPTVDTASILEQTTSISLPAGSKQYIFGFATGGCCPTSDFQFGQNASVNDAYGFRIASIAVTSSNVNSYQSQTAYNTIGGIAVSGFASWSTSYAMNSTPAASSVSDSFTVSGTNSLVVVFAIGGGEQCQQVSGIPDLQIDASTQYLNPVITISHAYVGPASYKAVSSTQQCAAGQDPNHAGDLLGIFIFNGPQNAQQNSNSSDSSQPSSNSFLNTAPWIITGVAVVIASLLAIQRRGKELVENNPSNRTGSGKTKSVNGQESSSLQLTPSKVSSCPSCGTLMLSDHTFCGKCGYKRGVR